MAPAGCTVMGEGEVEDVAALLGVDAGHGDVALGRVHADNRGTKARHRFAQQATAAAELRQNARIDGIPTFTAPAPV